MSLQGEFSNKENKVINSRLTVYNGNKVDKLDIKNENEATKIYNDIKNSTFKVGNITRKEARRNPYPAFTTSSMQIESSRKLGLSANQTMRTAQRLYEGADIRGETTGLITYMRTDSVIMSNEAINQVRSFVTDNYGANYLPDTPRVYKSKAKNAQEAHECIRPTNIRLTPKDIKQYITLEEFKLYEIIFLWVSSLIGLIFIVNFGLKGLWGRARPNDVLDFGGTNNFTPWYQISDQCINNCSFVSGDSSVGFALIVFYFIIKRTIYLWTALIIGIFAISTSAILIRWSSSDPLVIGSYRQTFATFLFYHFY